MHFFFNFQVVTPPVRRLVSSLGRTVTAVLYSLFSSLSLIIAKLLLVHRFSVRLFFCRTCALLLLPSTSLRLLFTDMRSVLRPHLSGFFFSQTLLGDKSLNHMLDPVCRTGDLLCCHGNGFFSGFKQLYGLKE